MKIFLPKNFEPQKPIKIYDYHDILITLFSGKIHPSQFNSQKMKEMGLIPVDWQLSKPILNKPKLLQFCFQQGISIVIEMGKISFLMKIGKNSVDLANIITNFINQLTTYNWQKVQINLRRLISLPGKKENGAKFIQDNFLHGDKWDISGRNPTKTQINFMYSLVKNPLIINLTDVTVRDQDNNIKSGLLFRGTFHYQYKPNFNISNRFFFTSVINNYPQNLELFNTIINQNLLS